MINPTLIVATWLLIGPPLPFSIAIGFLLVSLLSVFRYRLRERTIALVGVIVLMLIQCILTVFAIHLQLWQLLPPVHFTFPGAWLFQLLFGLDLRLAELGAVAAICAGIYIEFGRARLGLSQSFPYLMFSEPTTELIQMVQRLAEKAAIECPEVRLLDSGAPCAFTVHTKRKYSIAVSIGLLESFTNAEVEACIAHEICHIKNRDFALRLIVTIAKVALFARVLSYFIEAAFYRTRELLADRAATVLIGGPGALISALTKLQQVDYVNENLVGTTVCCFDGKKSVIEIMSKHPSLSTRISLLRKMEPASIR